MLFRWATASLIIFTNIGQTGLVSFNELLKCCIKILFFQQRSERLCKLLMKCCREFSLFQQQSRTGSEITGCFERTMILYMPRARHQSYHSTFFKCFRFQYNGLRLPLPSAYLQLLVFFLPFLRENVSQDTSRASSGRRAVINDITFPNSNTRRE